ncbi:hypothetical protein GOODEAATRI_010968 [Goodea atripinnis]|uniref:Uncharacterized protein n=1 Tax=Goodea atripinnis TaxID=208336 RepID=A0ABV0P3E7_9TELE
MKRGFSSQTLVYDSAYAPQIGLGIIVLGHDDFRSLCSDKQYLQIKVTDFHGLSNLLQEYPDRILTKGSFGC